MAGFDRFGSNNNAILLSRSMTAESKVRLPPFLASRVTISGIGSRRELRRIIRNGLMNGWMNGWMDRWMDKWMDGWIDGWMDGWMNGWIDEWMYEE